MAAIGRLKAGLQTTSIIRQTMVMELMSHVRSQFKALLVGKGA